jgi:hypothetical protein
MTQDEPIMHGSTEASDESKVAGIVEQVRADVQLRDSEEPEPLLRERLDQVGIALTDERVAELVAEIRNGPSVTE